LIPASLRHAGRSDAAGVCVLDLSEEPAAFRDRAPTPEAEAVRAPGIFRISTTGGASSTGQAIRATPQHHAIARFTARRGFPGGPHELAGPRDGATRGGDLLVKQRECVDHVGPDLQRDDVIGGAERTGKADGVVEQGLGGADLDQHRRQTVEVRIQR
jgi:hypothetical protein